jgi:hypothetical protein
MYIIFLPKKFRIALIFCVKCLLTEHQDTATRRTWDTGLKDIQLLVNLDDETDIVHIELSSFAGGAISARDLIDVR